MNVIREIRNTLEEGYNIVRINIYSETEVEFALYDSEVPIVVDPKNGEVYFDSELYKEHLYEEELSELAQIIGIIKKNMDEVRSWVQK